MLTWHSGQEMVFVADCQNHRLAQTVVTCPGFAYVHVYSSTVRTYARTTLSPRHPPSFDV